MTCIVGFLDKENDTVWIGGDSLASNGYSKNVCNNLKVFHHYLNKSIIIGSTTTFRHIDLLQYSENLFPELDFYKKKEIDREYMIKTFVPNLINLFQNNVYSSNNEHKGGNFIIGIKNKLFEIQPDYSVLEPTTGYISVGSGEDFALGSLYVTTHEHKNWTPERHIEMALKSAEFNSCGVQRPFRIINTKDEKEIII